MNEKLIEFITELIEEVNHLQQSVDSEYSTNFERADAARKETIKNYYNKLKEFKGETND